MILHYPCPQKSRENERFSSRLILRFYRDKIVKIGDFSSVFFKKTLIHKDFDEIIICSPQYNRRFF